MSMVMLGLINGGPVTEAKVKVTSIPLPLNLTKLKPFPNR